MLIPGSMVKADQERGDIIVYADEWCPYNCQPNSPEPGYLIEILKEVFAPLGQDISYQIRPWKRALNSVEIGVGDIAVGAVEGNHGNNIIGTISLGRDETVLVTRKKNSLNYLKPDDLKQHSIGMIKDYTYDNNGILDRYLEYRIDNGQGIYVVHNDRPLDSLYKMLINGRI